MAKFKRATKEAAKLRLALIGTAGSGKTYSALNIAKHFGGRWAVFDTENGSASKYASGKPFEFDTMDSGPSYHPNVYMEAIQAAEDERYDGLIIDSYSHVWFGRNGALELAGGSKQNWFKVGTMLNALTDKICRSKMHVIATLRSKAKYETQTNERGKVESKKIGQGAIAREDQEYEFDIVGRMDDAVLTVDKTRCPSLKGQTFLNPGKEFVDVVREELMAAEPVIDTTPWRDEVILDLAEKAETPEQLAEAKAMATEAKGLGLLRNMQAIRLAIGQAAERIGA